MRRNLATIAAALWSLSIATAAHAQAVAPHYGAVFDSIAIVRLTDGVYAFISPDSRSAFVSGNNLLVIGRDAALVVDAGHFPSLTRKVIAEVKRLTSVPVRYLVNTHWHEDHLAGNAEYAKAFPGLSIVSTVATRDTVRRKVPTMIADEVKNYPGFATQLHQRLDAGVTAEGAPIPAFSLEYNRNELRDLERAIPELASISVVPPTLAFDHELLIDLGGRDVELLWLGLGNTPGDAVAWVPDAKVVATGDLIVAPTPYAFGSFIYDWPATLRRLMALPAVAIVPGHGPVMHDWSYANLVATMLDTLGAQMTRAASAPSLDSASTRIDLRGFRTTFTGDDPYLQRAFDRFFLPSALQRAYEEASRRLSQQPRP